MAATMKPWALIVGFIMLAPACARDADIVEPARAGIQATVDDSARARERMVREQISARGISSSRVLAAMRKVPRHLFVPANVQRAAYDDQPLPIGHGQTISQPFIVAYMTEAADVAPNERVLEIGTGSGYQAAILGELAKEVYTIEIVTELAERARALLAKIGYANVTVKAGDGYQGWSERAPFDAIVVTAAPPEIPAALKAQLAMGGRMIVPVGEWDQQMVIIERTAQGLTERRTLPVRFVPMIKK